ncbi:hypothetical protein VP01_493g2 [Puccinia sorghi]|uniref:Uncharacterized protein n=1 Tax=Puccinia sorghi TaxID=27349 RepID=A0A0L6UM04_9BASI|nr:hypothetical protein VP01_493g2 [Puccinia sorghi]
MSYSPYSHTTGIPTHAERLEFLLTANRPLTAQAVKAAAILILLPPNWLNYISSYISSLIQVEMLSSSQVDPPLQDKSKGKELAFFLKPPVVKISQTCSDDSLPLSRSDLTPFWNAIQTIHKSLSQSFPTSDRQQEYSLRGDSTGHQPTLPQRSLLRHHADPFNPACDSAQTSVFGIGTTTNWTSDSHSEAVGDPSFPLLQQLEYWSNRLGHPQGGGSPTSLPQPGGQPVRLHFFVSMSRLCQCSCPTCSTFLSGPLSSHPGPVIQGHLASQRTNTQAILISGRKQTGGTGYQQTGGTSYQQTGGTVPQRLPPWRIYYSRPGPFLNFNQPVPQSGTNEPGEGILPCLLSLKAIPCLQCCLFLSTDHPFGNSISGWHLGPSVFTSVSSQKLVHSPAQLQCKAACTSEDIFRQCASPCNHTPLPAKCTLPSSLQPLCGTPATVGVVEEGNKTYVSSVTSPSPYPLSFHLSHLRLVLWVRIIGTGASFPSPFPFPNKPTIFRRRECCGASIIYSGVIFSLPYAYCIQSSTHFIHFLLIHYLFFHLLFLFILLVPFHSIAGNNPSICDIKFCDISHISYYTRRSSGLPFVSHHPIIHSYGHWSTFIHFLALGSSPPQHSSLDLAQLG